MTFVVIIALVSPVYGEGVHRCTEEYKFSYYDGKYCCRTQKENTFGSQGELCNGGPLGFYSKCCAGDQYQLCENPPCWNYDASARPSGGVYPADPATIAKPTPATIAIPTPAATPSLRNGPCRYECTVSGGCSVTYTGSLNADGRRVGSCYSKSFGGGCSGTPSACHDCNTMVTCEESAPVTTAPVTTTPAATAPVAAAASNLQATSTRESTYDRTPGMGWADDNNRTDNNLKQIKNLPHNYSHLACEAECNKTRDCVAYTYAKQYNLCDLKSPTGARQLYVDPKVYLYSGKKMNNQPVTPSQPGRKPVAPSRPAHQTVATSPPGTAHSSSARGHIILQAHNVLRCMHGADPLQWSGDLKNKAQNTADHVLGTCGDWLCHGRGIENLHQITNPVGSVYDWWTEHPLWHGAFNLRNGHFANIVAKHYKFLGCAVTTRGDGATACQYGPTPIAGTERWEGKCVKSRRACEAVIGWNFPKATQDKIDKSISCPR